MLCRNPTLCPLFVCAALYGVADETLSLATAVTSVVASAAASCCSVFGSGDMSAVVPAVAACTDCCTVCGCPHLLIVLHPSGTHCSLAETSILLGADILASRQ
jgi:hypothetical protein